MEVLADEGYTPRQLQKINKCRMYLRCFTAADVFNGYGDSFSNTYNVQRDVQPRNNYTWPRMQRPSSTAIKLWRKALQTCFRLMSGQMEYVLGRWLNNNYQGWIWFYDPNTQFIYQRFSSIWRLWKEFPNQGL